MLSAEFSSTVYVTTDQSLYGGGSINIFYVQICWCWEHIAHCQKMSVRKQECCFDVQSCRVGTPLLYQNTSWSSSSGVIFICIYHSVLVK